MYHHMYMYLFCWVSPCRQPDTRVAFQPGARQHRHFSAWWSKLFSLVRCIRLRCEKCTIASLIAAPAFEKMDQLLLLLFPNSLSVRVLVADQKKQHPESPTRIGAGCRPAAPRRVPGVSRACPRNVSRLIGARSPQ